MTKQQVRRSLIIVHIIALLVALAGAHNGQRVNGIPIFMICVGLAFLINWLALLVVDQCRLPWSQGLLGCHGGAYGVNPLWVWGLLWGALLKSVLFAVVWCDRSQSL